MSTSGGPAWIVAAVLAVAAAAAMLVSTPWQPFDDARPEMVTSDPDRDFTPAEQAAAQRYQADIRPPVYSNLAVGLGVALLLGLTPLGARLVTAAARPLGGGWVWQVLLGGLAVLLVMRLATLPLAAWAESVRRSYGLSTRDWPGWLGDVGRGLGVQVVGTLAALLVLIALARAVPRGWWLPAAGAAAVLVVAVSFAYPVVVEPVFNRFTPMPDGQLRTSLVELAGAGGVDVEEVLVADASRRTTTLNAYVSGLGATHRIVVYDTLLERAPEAEVRSIVAHELGHTAHHDVRNGTLLGALVAAAAVAGLGGLLSWRWLLDRSGAEGGGDPAVVPLVLAVVTVLSLVAAPVENLLSRRVETRADVFALDLTRDPETFVRMQHSLAVTAHSDPDPPAALFAAFASHPTAPQRISLARSWAGLHGVEEPPDLVDARR